MKKAVQFGAGNIGRGFIGALLVQSGYRVVFADVDRQLVERINRAGEYTVEIRDAICTDQSIEGVSAVDAAGDAVERLIAGSSLVTTAVGLAVLPKIAPTLARAIARRQQQGIGEPLNVIACENGMRASTQLGNAVLEHLDRSVHDYCRRFVGFPDCSVDRIVPPRRTGSGIDVVVERFSEWIVEREGFAGAPPQIEGMQLVDDLSAYIERKLFTLNTGHAIAAYLGRLAGYTTVDQSIVDPTIRAIVKGAMRESGEALIRRYGFDRDAHLRYIEKILSRFENPYLEDDVDRVGRQPIRKLAPTDRLVRPLLAARSYGTGTSDLMLGIAAALRYRNPQDGESLLLQEMIREQGVERTFAAITGIAEDAPLFEALRQAYSDAERLGYCIQECRVGVE